MASPVDLDPQLRQIQQTVEADWSPHAVPIETVMECFATEFGLAAGQRDPAEDERVLKIFGLIPDVVAPRPGVVDAVKDRAAYIEGVPAVGRALLAHHVEADGSRISLLPDDAEAYDAQRPMYFYVDGNPMPREATDFTARTVDPRYPEMMERLAAGKGAREAARYAIELQKRGISIIAITPHAGDIIDTAFGTKQGLDLFDEQGFTPERSFFNLNKSLAWGEYDVPDIGPVVMMDVVKTIAHRIYLPWAKSKASEEILSGLPEAEVDRNNRLVAENTNAFLYEGAYGTMSPTASTRNVSGRANEYHMSRVRSGPMRLMMHPNVYVMPMPMWRMGDEYVADCMMPVKIETEAQGHALMAMMAKTTTELLKGKADMSIHYAEN